MQKMRKMNPFPMKTSFLLFLLISFSYSALLLTTSYAFLTKIDSHFHETQLPKGYGEIKRLMPSSLSSSPDSYSSEELPSSSSAATGSDNNKFFSEDFATIGNTQRKKQQNLIQYVWTISNFTDLIKNSGEEIIFSPRFYLNEPGFRLQLLLVTNTTYSDMISYLGVFFRIVAGDYDADIEWPYRHRTTLSILKHNELDDWTNSALQSNGGEKFLLTKYNHTIIPNIDECRLRSAFLRPNSDIELGSNTDGCGNRRFIPLSALLNSNNNDEEEYLKDDELLIMLTANLNSDSDDKTFQNAAMSMRFNELVSNYIWSIKDFSLEKNESITTQKIVVLNAEPFYTHPNGYLIQLFLTLLPKRSAFAISFAFVQGDYDRYLQWPFPYSFEMAIVDQSPDYWKRDLTIRVKPSKSDCGTEPFSQPGPQPEFCFLTIQSLQVLSLTHYNFLLNDTLKIRFTTRFEGYSSRQRSSILLKNNRLVSEFNWLIPGLVARFQRYMSEQHQQQLQQNLNATTGGATAGANSGSGGAGAGSGSMLRRIHRFVSDEFYTNGQGYLCQLVLTVSVRNILNETNETQQQQQQPNSTAAVSQDVLVLNLELVIIEGEYDRFLEWPFNNTYELAIVGYKQNAINDVPNNNGPAGGGDGTSSSTGGGGTNDGEQFYFDKSEQTKTDSQIIIPMKQVQNGECLKESFLRPIKMNPPCGIREFIQMDLNNDPSTANVGADESSDAGGGGGQKQQKSIPLNDQQQQTGEKPEENSQDGTEGNQQQVPPPPPPPLPYELLGSLSKSDEDLHLRVRIYL